MENKRRQLMYAIQMYDFYLYGATANTENETIERRLGGWIMRISENVR